MGCREFLVTNALSTPPRRRIRAWQLRACGPRQLVEALGGGGRFGSGQRAKVRAGGCGKCAGLPMTRTVQNKLSKSLDHAKSSLRLGLAAARSRDFDIETGLRTRAHLHADLARLNGIPARLELLALQPGGRPRRAPCWAGPTPTCRSSSGARCAPPPNRSGARAYRLDLTLYAFLGPVEGPALTPGRGGAARARRGLRAPGLRRRSSARRGSPTTRPTGTTALAVAHERLRARSRWQRLSSERQVRDVLLQILSERRAGGSAVALPGVAAHAIGVGRRLGLALGAARRHRARRRDAGHRHAGRARGGAAASAGRSSPRSGR